MTTEHDREQKTWAFRKVGIIDCGHILSRHDVANPADQMIVIHYFLSHDTELSASRLRPREWLTKGLSAAASQWTVAVSKRDWADVLDSSRFPIAWKPVEEFGALLSERFGIQALRIAAERLRHSGVNFSRSQLLELQSDFACDQLPKAIRTFDPIRGDGQETRWLATAFYRYALRALRADLAREEQLLLLEPTVIRGETPEEAVLSAERGNTEAEVLRAMDRLPDELKVALSMYFGFGGGEATLREIGGTLGLTRFKARSLVVLGLAQLTYAAGVYERLSKDEHAFARKLFDDGVPPAQAARELGVDMNRMIRAMRQQFEGGLRVRTHSGVRGWSTDNGQVHRPGAPVIPEASEAAYVRGMLLALDRAPDLVTGRDNCLRVVLGNGSFSFDVVRRLIDDEIIGSLEARGVDLDWVLSGPARGADEDMSEIDRQLATAQETRWAVASELLNACEDEGLQQASGDERESMVLQICRAVVGAAQDIDRELPPQVLLDGNARLHVSGPDEAPTHPVPRRNSYAVIPVQAWWEPTERRRTFDIHGIFRRQSIEAGGMSETAAEHLASIVSRRLLLGEFVPDGLRFEGIHHGHAVFHQPWQSLALD